MIGGTSHVDYNVELNNIVVGFDRVCPTDLRVNLDRRSLYNQCPTSTNEIEVTYLAGHVVHFEIARKILLIPRRGDTVPEGVRDMVVVHLGGLPPEIEKGEIRVVKGGLDEPGLERRVIELGGRSRNRYSLEKQIINIGVKYDCKGKMELIEQNKKHVLVCKENTTDIVIRGEPGRQERTEVILTGQSKPVNRGRTEIILTGHSRGGLGREEVRETVRVETIETGTPPELETVALEDHSGSIQGQVLEIDQIDHVKAWNTEKYIEIGSNYVCDTKLDIKVIGSDIVCQCKENVTQIKYIGKGATDLEILRETIVLEGKTAWSQYQEQDFVIIYMGGIPKHVKQGKGKAILVTGLTAGKDGTKKENIIQIFGQSKQQNKNQRQIVLIGLSRQCTENLVTVKNHDSSIIGCVGDNGDDLIPIFPYEPEFGRSAAVEGKQWEYEMLFTVHDATDVFVDNGKILVEQSFCSRSVSDILSDGKRVIVDCSGDDRNLEIVYVGQGPAELYLNKRTLDIANRLWKDRNLLNNSVLLYVGDGARSHFEYQRGVKYFRNIGNMLDGLKSVLNAPYTVDDHGENRITVIELGYTVTCDGTLEKIVENTRIVVSCKRQVDNVEGSAGSGQHSQQTVTVLGHSPAKSNITKTITLTGQSSHTDKPDITDEHKVLNRTLPTLTEIDNADFIEFNETHGRKFIKDDRQVVSSGKRDDNQVQIETRVNVVTSNSDQEKVKQDRLDIFGVQEKIDDNSEHDEKIDKSASNVKQSRLDLLGKKEIVHSDIKHDTSLDRGFGSEDNHQEKYFTTDTPDSVNSDVKQNRLDLFGKKESVHSETKHDMEKDGLIPHVGNDTVRTDHGLSIDISISVDTTGGERDMNINTDIKKDRLEFYGRVDEVDKPISNIGHEGTMDMEIKRDRLDLFGTVERLDRVKPSTEGKDMHSADLYDSAETANSSDLHTEESDTSNIDRLDHYDRVDTVDVDNAQSTLEVSVTNRDVKKDRLELYGKKERTHTDGEENAVIDVGVGLNKDHVKGKKIDRLFLFGNAEYVKLNESQQNIEVGLKNKCVNGYNVTLTNGNLEFKCENEGPSLDVLYIGGQDTEIGINTIARAENASSFAQIGDKVVFHLSGWKSSLNGTERHFQVFNVSSLSGKKMNISNTISIDKFTEVISKDDFVTVIDIGISKPCLDGSLVKYEGEDGEIVYCSRRSDILPEDSHGSRIDSESGADGDSITVRNFDSVGHGLFKQTSDDSFSVDIPTTSTQPSRRGDVPIESHEDVEENTLPIIQTAVLEVTNTSERLSGTTFDDDRREDLVSNIGVSGQISHSEISGENSSYTAQRPIKSEIRTTPEKGEHNSNLNVAWTDAERLPRRGDVDIDQFDKAFKDTSQDVRTNAVKNKRNSTDTNSNFNTEAKSTNNSVRRVNIELNETVELDVGNDCRGKIEAIEMNGAVMIKCTVGGETLELNLVGLGPGNDNERKTFYVLNDDPGAFQNDPQSKNTTRFVTDFIGERKRLVQGDALDAGTFKTIHEVYYASRMRYLNESKSKGYDVRNVVFVDHDKNMYGHTPFSGRGDILPESEEEYKKHKHEHTDIDDLKIVHDSKDSLHTDGLGKFRKRRHVDAPDIHVSSERNYGLGGDKTDPSSGSTKTSPEYAVIDALHDDLTIAGFNGFLKARGGKKSSGQMDEGERRLRHKGRLQLKGKGYKRIKSISGKPKLIKLHQRRGKLNKGTHKNMDETMIDTMLIKSDVKMNGKSFGNNENVQKDTGYTSHHRALHYPNTDRSSNIGLIGKDNLGHILVVDTRHEPYTKQSAENVDKHRTVGIVQPAHQTESHASLDISVDMSRASNAGHEGRQSGTSIVTDTGGIERDRAAGATDCNTSDLGGNKITSRRVLGSSEERDSVSYGITVVKLVGK